MGDRFWKGVCNALGLMVLTFLVVFAIFHLVGCASVHPTTGASTGSLVAQHPAPLAAVATSLNHLIILSVIVVGIGVSLFFLLPAAHATSISLMTVAAGIEVSALVTRETLWLVPWFCWGLGVVALLYFAYEVYANRAALGVVVAEAKADIAAVEKKL